MVQLLVDQEMCRNHNISMPSVTDGEEDLHKVSEKSTWQSNNSPVCCIRPSLFSSSTPDYQKNYWRSA